jgi:hypothetical protein
VSDGQRCRQEPLRLLIQVRRGTAGFNMNARGEVAGHQGRPEHLSLRGRVIRNSGVGGQKIDELLTSAPVVLG